MYTTGTQHVYTRYTTGIYQVQNRYKTGIQLAGKRISDLPPAQFRSVMDRPFLEGVGIPTYMGLRSSDLPYYVPTTYTTTFQ